MSTATIAPPALDASMSGARGLEHELKGALERAVYWFLLDCHLEGSQFENDLGITSDVLDVDLLETFGRQFSACARAMRIAEGAPMPRDGDPALVEILDEFIAGLKGENPENEDDKVLNAARLVMLQNIRFIACGLRPVPSESSAADSPAEAASEMATESEPSAGPITIDLTGRYMREFMAHILSHRLADLSEGAGDSLTLDVPTVDFMVTKGLAEVLDPYFDHCAPMGRLVVALLEVTDCQNEVLRWPFGRDELRSGAEGCVQVLHESLALCPEDKLEDYASALKAARAFSASLEAPCAPATLPAHGGDDR